MTNLRAGLFIALFAAVTGAACGSFVHNVDRALHSAAVQRLDRRVGAERARVGRQRHDHRHHGARVRVDGELDGIVVDVPRRLERPG